MVPRTHGQRSVFEIVAGRGRLWGIRPRRIDEVLGDETLVELVWDALCGGGRRVAGGSPGDAGRGRVRVLVLKHLLRLELRRVRAGGPGNLRLPGLCRIDCEKVPRCQDL